MLIHKEKVSQSTSTSTVKIEIIIKGLVTGVGGMARNPRQAMAQASYVNKMSFGEADTGFINAYSPNPEILQGCTPAHCIAEQADTSYPVRYCDKPKQIGPCISVRVYSNS